MKFYLSKIFYFKVIAIVQYTRQTPAKTLQLSTTRTSTFVAARMMYASLCRNIKVNIEHKWIDQA